MKKSIAAAAFCALGMATLAQAMAAEITVERNERGATVKIDGRLFTEYRIDSNGKSILWPLIGPTDKPITRAYPMDKADAHGTTDHVHHRSVWFGHGDVNGIDFWTEKPNHGSIRHRDFVKIGNGDPALVVTRNDWIGPQGDKQCEDQRTLRFGVDGDNRWIDFDIALKATAGPVHFGDTKEGCFAVRVADTMTVDAKQGGQIVNHRGQKDAKAWGQAAEWIDYHGPVDGETVGIAIFNHPDSFRFPTRWHVRNYGLFAANPSGPSAFAKGKKNDSFTLPAGESLTLRYRIWLHRGDHREGKVAEACAAYVGSAP